MKKKKKLVIDERSTIALFIPTAFKNYCVFLARSFNQARFLIIMTIVSFFDYLIMTIVKEQEYENFLKLNDDEGLD